jgi:hypothetical protein
LQSLQAEEGEHTCGRATTGAAEQQTVEAGGVGQPTAPEGSLAPRPARSGGRPGSANTDVQSRCCWSSQSSQCMDCAACRVEWIREYDKSQHISRPTADAAIAASRRAVERDRWGRCTRAYQLLALAAISHRRLGADTASALFRLPFDLHEKVASFSRVPTEHVADRFVEDEGWAWARTATLSMQANNGVYGVYTSPQPPQADGTTGTSTTQAVAGPARRNYATDGQTECHTRT